MLILCITITLTSSLRLTSLLWIFHSTTCLHQNHNHHVVTLALTACIILFANYLALSCFRVLLPTACQLAVTPVLPHSVQHAQICRRLHTGSKISVINYSIKFVLNTSSFTVTFFAPIKEFRGLRFKQGCKVNYFVATLTLTGIYQIRL